MCILEFSRFQYNYLVFVVVMMDFVPWMLFNISIYVFSLQKNNYVGALWGDASVTWSMCLVIYNLRQHCVGCI